MKQIIIRAISLSVIPIVVGALLAYITKSNKKEMLNNLNKEHILVHLPKVNMWVGFLSTSFFLVCFFMMLLFPNDTVNIGTITVISLFILLGIFLVASSLNWRIRIFRDKDYLIYRTSFGRTYKIQYKDFVCYKDGNSMLTLKTENKSFFVDKKATNLEFLIERLQQQGVNKH